MIIQNPTINFGNITGSLSGTSSWSISSSFALTGSRAITSSYSISALTASYALNAIQGITIKEQGLDHTISANTINFQGNSVDVTGGGSSVTVDINQRDGVERVTKIDFTYQTNTATSPIVLNNNGLITRIRVLKNIVFNGTNPRARITIPSKELMDLVSANLTSTLQDVNDSIHKLDVNDNNQPITITFTHTGSTQGQATAYIFYTDSTATS